MATLAAALVLGCAPPDTPPALSAPLPDAVLEMLRPDTVRTVRVGDGVWYRYLWSPEGPWAVHLIEADFRHCDLGLRALQASAREDGGLGHEPVTSMARRAPGEVLAAVNADFFTREGGALGSEVVRGRVTRARARPALAWRPGDVPWVGDTRVTGDTLWGGWPVPFGAGDGRTELVGGDPELLDSGALVGDLTVSVRPGFAATRHPRTAVGYSSTSGRVWLLVVDGRQAPHSVGMTLPETTALLQALGAADALNLDGGGSSVMVVAGVARNRPSDESGERAVVNALALVRDREACRTSPAG